ncbi:MAG: ComEC/Rec2 family competence protein [Candidatus Levybacteria bacterium]|nr:ComEC/Rec2 family competence protein [Candidatus Levybacteria bacterium]
MSRLALCVLLITLGLRFFFFYHNQPQFTDGQKISFKTTLLSEPQFFSNQQIFTANLASNQSVRVVTGRFPEFHYGDSLQIVGSIKLKLLNNKSKIAIIYFPKIEETNSSGIWGISLGAISNVRQKLISLFSKTLPSPFGSLMLGIIFGIKSSMSKEFADNLKFSGVYHVIAASGMNVTLIGGFISSFLAFFLKRQMALLISILGIIFYAVLGGLEPSIVRAAIMGIIVFSAQILGRQTLAVNSLFLAGFAMLFISPSLISDIGFQLSFVATLGILYIKPFLERGKRVKVIERMGSLEILTTIAAQIATLPILLANFGAYSAYSVLVNGLVLWTVPILMAIGGISAIFGLVIEPLGQLIIYLCYPLLIYFETVVNFFGKIGGVLVVKDLPWQFIAGYYCLLASVLIISKRRT